MRNDPKRSFRINLDTMRLVTESGAVYQHVYLWKGFPAGYERMNEDQLKSIDFTKISYPALDDSYMRVQFPVDGENMCVYFKRVE